MTKQNKRPSALDLLKKFESAEKALEVLSDTEAAATTASAQQTLQAAEVKQDDSNNLVEEIVIWRKDPNSFSEKKCSFLLTRTVKGDFEAAMRAIDPQYVFVFDWKVDALTDADRRTLENLVALFKDANPTLLTPAPVKNFKMTIEKNDMLLSTKIYWDMPLEKVFDKHNAMRAVLGLKARHESGQTKIAFIHNRPLADMSDVIGMSIDTNHRPKENTKQETSPKRKVESTARGRTWKPSREMQS